MRHFSKLQFVFLATSALATPSGAIATTLPPQFIDLVDANGVDLVSGLPSFAIDEGGIGSGPGAVRMRRVWAQGAGFVDNWSGGLFARSVLNTQQANVNLAGINSSFLLAIQTGAWFPAKGNGSRLTSDSSGYYYFTRSDGTQVKFDNNTAGASPTSCPGTTTETCHVPILVTQPNGLKVSLTWDYATTDHRPRLRTVSSAAGYSLAIAYASDDSSSANWTKRTTVTFNNSANPPSPVPTVTYSYPSSTEFHVTDPAGRMWVFTSDSSGRLTGITRPGSGSNNITYAYGSDGTVSSSTKDGVTNTYSRVVSGTSVTETMTDPLSQQTVVGTTTDIGRPVTYKDPLNRTTTVTFDTFNRPVQLTQPENNYVQFTYDARGNITDTTFHDKTNSSTIATHASYDASCANPVTCNRPNTTTDANGNITTYTYDGSHGGLTSLKPPKATTNAVQPQIILSYLPVTSAGGDPVYMLTGTSQCQTQDAGTCTNTSDETKTGASYNNNLLATSISRSDGTGGLIATSTMTYDSRGNLLTVDGPLATATDTTAYKYDLADQPIGVISPDPDGAGPLPYRAIRFVYRPDGQVSDQQLGTTSGQTDTDFNNIVVSQHADTLYDGNSRPYLTRLWDAANRQTQTQFSYDALGRLDLHGRADGPQPVHC